MDQLGEFLNANNGPEVVEEPEAGVAAAAEAPETPQPEGAAQQSEAEAEGRARVPKGQPGAGQFAATAAEEARGETNEGAPPAPEEESGTIPVSALKAERSKRQAVEEQLRTLQAQLAQGQLQPPPQMQVQVPPPQAAPVQQPAPDRWDDPEGYDRWLIAQVSAQAAEVARAEATRTFELQRVAGSAQQFSSQKPDYAEKIGVFEQMVAANPILADRMMQAANPAEFAYNTARTHLEIAQYGGIDGLISARVQEALKGAAQAQPQPEPSPPIPDSLADAQSSRTATPVAVQAPSLSEILGRPAPQGR